MITFICGGSGSGKSEYAEQLILSGSMPDRRYYIATMIPYGEEGRKRVARHVKLREGKGFQTIECPTDLSRALLQIDRPESAAVLIECVSNLAANEMFENHLNEKETEEKIFREILFLCRRTEQTVIVSNNIFEDGIRYDDDMTAYLRSLAKINQRLARVADEICEVTAGLPVKIKEQKGGGKMDLVIGGFAQGKLEYVLKTVGETFQEPPFVFDETCPELPEKELSAPAVIIDHLHLILQRFPDQGAAEQWIRHVIERCEEEGSKLVFICDEVGNGVIPVEAGQRQFREMTGRILCKLAQEADHVTRIFCGIPQLLK